MSLNITSCLIVYKNLFHFLGYVLFLFFPPVGNICLLQAIANACKVQATFVSHLTESDVSDDFEKQFTEDEELEQLINGQICFKVYPFSSGMV